MVLHCVYYAESFESGMLRLINMRGDADSTAAVLGQILGALYGI
jgi:ADP-ribosylglycohydrolase